MKLDNPETNVFPLSLETFEISSNLLSTPKTLGDLAVQYHNQRNILNKKEQELENPEENLKFKSFLNSFLADTLILTAALTTLIKNTGYHICNVWTV